MPISQKQNKGKRLIIVILSALFLFISCSAERKLAKKYITNAGEIPIMLLSPDYLYKINLKSWQAENTNTTKTDSILFAKSTYLKLLSDSLFIARYMNAFSEELGKLHFKVYSPLETTDFLSLDNSDMYIINMAQLQIEEDIIPVTNEAYFADTIHLYNEFGINSVNLCSWFEISGVNNQDSARNSSKKLLYSEESAKDYFDGAFKFNVLNQSVYFEYTYDSLQINDIYDLAAYAGAKYGSYFFDYLMNQYISNNFSSGIKPDKYFHFDLATRKLKQVSKYRFIEMEQK
ncbi:MAG: hypothetical protein M0R21_04705 [Lentimicrobiaceae bacterium]|nr:hypothetical protein [Lentimicrobiaceae bacterium]